MKQLLVLGLAFYLLLLACKKDANPVVKPEDNKTTAADHIPDSLLTGGGIVGKWQLTKVSGGMSTIRESDFSKNNVFLFLKNNDSLLAISDIKMPTTLDFPEGRYSYSFKILRPVNYNYGGFKDHAELNLNSRQFGCYISDSTLMLIQDYESAFWYFDRIK